MSFWKSWINKAHVPKEKVYEQVVSIYRLTPVMSEQLHEDYNQSLKHHCVPFPGLVELLDELQAKGIQLGLITNGRGRFQMENIRALGIESYFETNLISEIEGMKKPDPMIFHAAMERMGVTVEEKFLWEVIWESVLLQQ